MKIGDIIKVWCPKCAEYEMAFVSINNGKLIYTGIDCEKLGGWLDDAFKDGELEL